MIGKVLQVGLAFYGMAKFGRTPGWQKEQEAQNAEIQAALYEAKQGGMEKKDLDKFKQHLRLKPKDTNTDEWIKQYDNSRQDNGETQE